VQATRTGRPIGQVAGLPTSAILALLEEEAPTPRRLRQNGQADASRATGPAADDLREACLRAIGDFDAVALELQLRRAIVALSADEFLDAVVVPLVDHLRMGVLDGSVRRPHGHLAHAVLRRVLDHVVATATAPLHSRDLVVATLGAHAHELDALIVAAAAAADGWRVTYVGTGVPTEDVAEMVQHLDGRVLALSQAASSGDRVIPRELRRLRALLPARIELLVVATTADVQRAALAETGATPIVGLRMLRTRLRALAGGASAKNGTTDRASSRPRIRSRR